MSSIFDNMFKGLPEASEEAKGIISDIQETMSQGFVPSFGDDFAGEMEIADQSLIDFLKTTETSSISLENYQKYLKQTSSATSTLSVITSGAGKVLKIFAATAINAFASVVVAKVIQEIYEAYDQWANRIEYAAEAMESAKILRGYIYIITQKPIGQLPIGLFFYEFYPDTSHIRETPQNISLSLLHSLPPKYP